jgi:parallel beta-helix repeat protein
VNDDQLYGQAVAQLRANQILLDRFQLHGILGRSAICLTWLATERRAQRFVCLKFIPQPIRQFPEHLEDLDRASRFVRSLKHENIASIYEFIVTHEWSAFSMEAIDGETLAQMVAKEPYGVFDIAKLSSYITEVCLGLHYAHNEGVIHDDIKPSNIMRVADGGHIKITDFHISRAINNAAANVVRRLTPVDLLPQNDFVLRHGSAEALKFMSPQRAFGIEPTPQDDIYSLGATIYYLLTGSLPVRQEHLLNPIEATTPAKMSLKLRENGIRNRFIPASWDATIAACLERKHQNRPQSILEFAHALDLDLGIPYKPKAEDKAVDAVPSVELATTKDEKTSSRETFKFPATHSTAAEQPFFAAAMPSAANPSSVNSSTIGRTLHEEKRPQSSTIAAPPTTDQEQSLKHASDTGLKQPPTAPPPPVSHTVFPATGNPSSGGMESSPSLHTQENYQQPNFSRGPRTSSPPTSTASSNINATVPPSARQDVSFNTNRPAVPPAPVSPPPTSSPPPRPAAYTPPPSPIQPGHKADADFSAPSNYSSSPFQDEPADESSPFQYTEDEAFSEKQSARSSEEPLPYEEIDEKDLRTGTAPSRKTSQRTDPSNQRSRYAQRSRVSNQDRIRSANFNPPPPYAYQQHPPPPPSSNSNTSAGAAKKRSNWQSNLIKILLAVFIFYACVFMIWFSLIKLGILPEENYNRFSQFFKKKPTPENIIATETLPSPSYQPTDDPAIIQQSPPPPPTPSPTPTNATLQSRIDPLPPQSPPLAAQPPVEVQNPNQNMELPQEPAPVTPTTPAPSAPITTITGPTKIVPDEYIQIQAAIDAASAGETIRIKAGIYTENIILKEGIKIIGEGMDVVTLQCPPTSPAIDIRNIQNGYIEGISIMHTEKLETENTPPLVNITNSNVEITRCRILNSSGTGVHIANGSRAVLRQNIIEKNNLFGISIMDAGTTPIIERNQINNNQRVGIVFSNGASGTAIGNIIKENQWDGIAVLNPATNPTIQQNITIENQRRGIFFAKGAGGIAEGNTSEKNKMNGISVLDEGTAPTISNNRVSNNELRGIHFGKGAKGIARGNISENNGDIGILIVDEGTRPELHNNTARNNEGWGIAIAQEALPPPSSGNIARDNKQGQINFEQTR